VALHATVYRFAVQLSHVDRGVYQALDLRLARHPSESERYLLARVIAYCMLVEDNPDVRLEFSKGGLSSPDEPALSMRTLDGRLQCWVEIGTPSVDRLHKAAKAAPRVVVVTQHDPALLRQEIRGKKVHRVEDIELYAPEPGFLDAIAVHIGERGCALDVTISEGELYVTAGGAALQTNIARLLLSTT
jgi:uncharacterized protein YaeQ